MRAGRLRNRVTVQSPADTTDDCGQPLDDWFDVADRWASVEPINGREFWESSGEHSEVTTRIRLRYDPALAGIHTGWRVWFSNQRYDVLYVINQDAADRELVLMCRRGAHGLKIDNPDFDQPLHELMHVEWPELLPAVNKPQ